HNRPAPLLDTNMARVLERFFGPRQLVDIRYDPYLQLLAHSVVDGTDAIRANWAILDLAAGVCRRRSPMCTSCPVRSRCRYAMTGVAEQSTSIARRGVGPSPRQ